MHIHLLGIAGTFMAGIAVLAQQLGHRVTGTDEAVYPPMSDLLAERDITVKLGYDSHRFEDMPDLILVGNALSRGNPLVEIMLNQRMPYLSGPEWLSQAILRDKLVFAVAGTHGKTTTSSMLSWILEQAGLNPSYLIGGKPGNFLTSARLTDSPYFVIEADEYDTAFFDKRAKLVHYQPHYLILNNLEFDHADIYPDLAAIQKQIHHAVRLVPQNGHILYPYKHQAIEETLSKGCWTPTMSMGADEQATWSYQLTSEDATTFTVAHDGQMVAKVRWPVWGEHNVQNALGALAASIMAGVTVEQAVAALSTFKPSARRMEHKATVSNTLLFEDFAHHPTAIATTLAGLKARFPKRRILCALELRSYTMRHGFHQETLPQALAMADKTYVLQPKELTWSSDELHLFVEVDELSRQLLSELKEGDVVLLMSNGAFADLANCLPRLMAEAFGISALT